MRLSRLKGFSFSKYQKLKADFCNPLNALLASTGLSGKTFTLLTRDGNTMQVDRSDLPVWQEYFKPTACNVGIKNGLFHISPMNPAHPAYNIKGASTGFTYQPKRWQSASHLPLVNELEQAEKSVYSQHGEDGVIQALLKHIPIKHQYVVEFGAYDGDYMSNSRHLIKDHGWNALLIEPDPRFFKRLHQLYRNNPRVTMLNEFIYKENINALFKRGGVPKDFEVLSIDVDGPDYYLWQALTDFTPKIVILESNPSISANEIYIVAEEDSFRFSGTAKEGASLQAFYELGKQKGYHLVYIELSGANLFFVHDSCIEYFDIEGIEPGLLYQPPQFGALAGGSAPNGRGYI